MTEKTWGGARPGSGRKPAKEDKRVQMVVTVDRSTRDKLKAIAKDERSKPGRILDNMVEKYGD